MQRLDDFMGTALATYYNQKDPLGVDGDFTTAPEISQLFGEIIGIWAIQQWITMGSPSQFNLIELGPGRGTLMADLLRGTAHIPGFHDSMAVHLVETSETLKEKQANALPSYNVQWHDHLLDIDHQSPTIIIANEFFDALPIRQFKYQDGTWMEHYIDHDQSIWVPCTTAPPMKKSLPPPQNDDIFEYSEIQQNYAALIARYRGAALIIDYGYQKSAYGDSLQALYKHKPCAITDHVGQADLTSHIDFQWLGTFFNHSVCTSQAQFLKKYGIDIRYQHLNNATFKSGYNRLISDDEMGFLFKALEIYSYQAP